MKIHCTQRRGGGWLPVKIRLSRKGAKKNPFYRIVVADSRSPRDGRFIESIGYYNPMTEPSEIKIDEEKAKEWLNKGAIPTSMVRHLLNIKGIVKGIGR
ncbi:small subunit ribosomal protein S16 [Candidatus Hakubella thermalkaliphila]|uniref:Small ribosomal subunit protein bS16 n=2 Tax=Candidatus Hakubella thermalkaliphila TaxID=2754717 RepID=A0A6V8QBY1_9ACTN|nr:small subunit ribosomal protein S16 [Candidatus Hakubella thermalkaliphila]GFP42215.1 small subunit ribosomal protein S16 [Candidatus Hakubella thermalkaliphila]